MKLAQSIGYRLGRGYLSLARWERYLRSKAQAMGWPRWVSKLPFFLVLLLIAGLLIAGLIMVALVMVALVIVPVLLSAVSSNLSEEEDRLNMHGYRDGPEGYGEYSSGHRIDDGL